MRSSVLEADLTERILEIRREENRVLPRTADGHCVCCGAKESEPHTSACRYADLLSEASVG